MWIPDTVYEALPPTYAVAGIATLIYSPGLVGVVSGLLLVTAGGVVWQQRRGSRKQAEDKRLNRASGRLNVKL